MKKIKKDANEKKIEKLMKIYNVESLDCPECKKEGIGSCRKIEEKTDGWGKRYLILDCLNGHIEKRYREQ